VLQRARNQFIAHCLHIFNFLSHSTFSVFLHLCLFNLFSRCSVLLSQSLHFVAVSDQASNSLCGLEVML